VEVESPDIVSIDTVPDNLLPDAAPPRPPFTRTATLFGALRTCLFEAEDAACRLLQLLTTYGRKIPGSRFLAGTVAMTTFLFLRVTHDPSELPRIAVFARRAAHRPSNRDPGAGSSWLPRFARPRCLDRRDTFLELPRGSSVPIDVHGSLDRAKDVSSKRGGAF
jgi:hypothetical protein